MSEAVKNWINASLVLLSAFGLSGLTCTTVTGCANADSSATVEERQALAGQRLDAAKQVMEAFGIEGEAFVSVGPMRFGFEELFIVDHGVNVQAHLKTDPLKAKAWAVAMGNVDQGMPVVDAITDASTKTGAKIVTPTTQPASHED